MLLSAGVGRCWLFQSPTVPRGRSGYAAPRDGYEVRGGGCEVRVGVCDWRVAPRGKVGRPTSLSLFLGQSLL